MNRRLAGQTAWISGAASGIGEGVARLFAAEGAKLLLVDLQADLGQRLAEEINAAGGQATFLKCDVTQENEVRESLNKAISLYGGLQIVVNCAAIVHVKLLDEYTEQEWDRLMSVNVKSIFFSIKHALPHLRKNSQSYMVNVGSISSFVAQGHTPAYTTSKGAVLSLTQSIALDYAADGLRCNCVCPGITDTPMLRHHLNATGDPAGVLSGRLRRVPIGRALTPDDIARSVLYLSCEDSAGVTGTSLVVDGGYLTAAEWQTKSVTLPKDLA